MKDVLNDNENALIKFTKAFLLGEVPEIMPEINYNAVFRLAKEHNLASVVYCSLTDCRGVFSEPVQKESKQFFLDYIYLYEHQKIAIEEIREQFPLNKIKFIFFKGAVVRELYPVPESRVMGDIDILIQKENRKKVKNLLISLGYKCNADNGDVWNYSRGCVQLEIHTKMMSGKTGTNTAPEEAYSLAWNHAIFNGYEGFFENEFAFSFMIAHIAHHFWFYGAGIRQILDLAVMIKKLNLDFELIESYLEKAGLLEFGKNILGICNKWYSLGLKYECSVEETEKFICAHGAFGGANRNKSVVITRKALEEGRSTNSLFVKFSLLFPSYEKMRSIPYIKFIDGRKYLVPWAWIYRILYNLIHRYDFVKNATSNLSRKETKELAKKEFELFKEIGLL